MHDSDGKIMSHLKSDLDRGGLLLFNRYYKPLLLFAYSATDHWEDAEDVVQDIFYRFIFQKTFQKIEDKALSSYLFQAVKNECIDRIRKKKNHRAGLAGDVFYQMIEEENMIFDSGMVEEVLKAVNELPPQTGRVIRAAFIERKKYKEIAGELNVSVNTVKTLLKNGLKQLRRQFPDTLLLLVYLKKRNKHCSRRNAE